MYMEITREGNRRRSKTNRLVSYASISVPDNVFFSSSSPCFIHLFWNRTFYDWITGKNRPNSGSLIQVVTTGGKTELVAAAHLWCKPLKVVKLQQRRSYGKSVCHQFGWSSISGGYVINGTRFQVIFLCCQCELSAFVYQQVSCICL